MATLSRLSIAFVLCFFAGTAVSQTLNIDPEGGGPRALYRTGDQARYTLSDLRPGRYQLAVFAKGEHYDGPPTLRLFIDGQRTGSDNDVNSTRFSRQKFGEVRLEPGQQVAVEFINDKWGGSSETDRNVFVDQLELQVVELDTLFDSIVGISDGATLSGVLNGGVEAVMRDGGTIDQVAFTINDANGTPVLQHTERQEAYCLAGGNGPCNDWDSAELPNGQYQLAITAEDNAGQSDTRTLAFTVDNGVALDPVVMPLEVIGPDNYTVEAEFMLEDAAGIDTLYLLIHRPVYRDVTTNAGRGPKASVKLNDGQWLAIDNANFECEAHEAAYGCLNGAYHTLRIRAPIYDAVNGVNRIQFRFHGTDGFTSGYRVLSFNLERNGTAVLSPETFVQDDPFTWQPPIDTVDAVLEGETLWNSAELIDGPDGSPIKASCAGCHANDGRDLQYFAYSNWSIIQRSLFHGLSQEQSEKIASYIRTRPAEPHGRPWNPPYQPGPGLDALPPEQWSAGAGIEWVLERDDQMLDFIFPDGISAAAIGADKMLNAREIPVSIQFPDWNDWLPTHHPEDIWGDYFLNTPAYNDDKRAHAYAKYLQLHDALAQEGVDSLIDRGRLDNLIQDFTVSAKKFFLDSRYGDAEAKIPDSFVKEEAVRDIRLWAIVKQWDVNTTYKLVDKAPLVYDKGEARSWLGRKRSVFEIAPHLSADNSSHFAYQDQTVGKYFSTAWYELQLTINSGNGKTGANDPVDWSYQPNHIHDLSTKVDVAKHPLRLTKTLAKMLQQYHGQVPGAWRRAQLHPGRYQPETKLFEDMPAAFRAELYNALLGSLMDELESHAISDWPRGDNRGQGELEPADYVPQMLDRSSLGAPLHKGQYADSWYTVIPRFRDAGVDATILTRMIDWGEAMWPNGDWDQLR